MEATTNVWVYASLDKLDKRVNELDCTSNTGRKDVCFLRENIKTKYIFTAAKLKKHNKRLLAENRCVRTMH